MNNSLTTIFFALVMSAYLIPAAFAQQKDQACCPGGVCSCLSEGKILQGAKIRAEDWVKAWQIAKESCAGADSLAIQFVDRPGPSFQSVKVFECVDLKATGELLIIKVLKGDKQQEESVLIIRASDMLRIEVVSHSSEKK